MLTIQNTTNNHDHSTAKNYDVVYTYLFFICTFQKAMINPLQSYLQALSLCSSNSKNVMVMLGSVIVKDVAT